MSRCGYQCHEIGGPWIAENPDCPIHGRDAQDRNDDLSERLARIEARLDALEAKNHD